MLDIMYQQFKFILLISKNIEFSLENLPKYISSINPTHIFLKIFRDTFADISLKH